MSEAAYSHKLVGFWDHLAHKQFAARGNWGPNLLTHLFVAGFEERGRRVSEEGEGEADFLFDCTL